MDRLTLLSHMRDTQAGTELVHPYNTLVWSGCLHSQAEVLNTRRKCLQAGCGKDGEKVCLGCREFYYALAVGVPFQPVQQALQYAICHQYVSAHDEGTASLLTGMTGPVHVCWTICPYGRLQEGSNWCKFQKLF